MQISNLRGKGKGKSTRSTTSKGKSAKSTGKGFDRPRPTSAPSEETCLRCGQRGHWASNCPHASRKRTRTGGPEDQQLLISTHAEHIDEIFLQRNGFEACEAVLDGGAQSFVVGNGTLQKYWEFLQSIDIKWKPKMLNCDRIFRFGNDETSHCNVASVIPVNFAGKNCSSLRICLAR